MKRYVYLLFVFREKIHEILGHEYPGDQGDLVALFVGKSFVNALHPPGFEVSWNTPSKTLPCSVYFGNQGDRLPWWLNFAEIFLPQWDLNTI